MDAVVSYRSVPCILKIFKNRTRITLDWVPHFTSVINWTLRLGLAILKQVAPINDAWVAIIDHSIDIGTKKVLVVLRVRLDALSQREKAIRLEDCECIGLKVSETVNGKSISDDLKDIFSSAGTPTAILKDCERTLQKGVRLWSEGQGLSIPVIDDIGHVVANSLKSEFGGTDEYNRFTSMTTLCAKQLRQTSLAFLTPPKLRTKGRFQNVGNLGKWGVRMLAALPREGELSEKLRKALPDFNAIRPFIKRFASTTSIVSTIMETLKNKGLDQGNYEECRSLTEELPAESKVKEKLQDWLKKHIEIQNEIVGSPLLVSSDIIESLFGNFKHIIERSPQADMNRTTLLIPALCGKLDEDKITQALSNAKHKELSEWEKENIPYTVQKKRTAFFEGNNIQKLGNLLNE